MGRLEDGLQDKYFAIDAPVVNIDRTAPNVTVCTATEKTQQSTGTGDLNLPHLPSGFPIKGHLMPGSRHSLLGVGPLCDSDCTVTFTCKAIIIQDKQGTEVLTGCCEATGYILWRIALQPGESNLPNMPNDANLATLAAYSAYDPPIVTALIRYLHPAAGYPVWSTWLKEIRAGSYSSWPGLTLSNATKHFPSAYATIMGNLVQKC